MAATSNHPKPGTIIGTPYQGTHGKAFNQQGGSDNWQSENAVDVWLFPGTAVTAIGPGVISPAGWGYGKSAHGGRFAGFRCHLILEAPTPPFVCFYTHMQALVVPQGGRVHAGDVIGWSGIANGVPHLHFAVQPGYNPADYVRQAYNLKVNRNKQPQPPQPPQPPPPGSSGGNNNPPQRIEDSWHQLVKALHFTWPDATEAIRAARGRLTDAVN